MYQYIIPQFTVWLCQVVDTVMRAGSFKMGKFALSLASLATAAKPKYDIAGNSRSRLMISQAAATLRVAKTKHRYAKPKARKQSLLKQCNP